MFALSRLVIVACSIFSGVFAHESNDYQKRIVAVSDTTPGLLESRIIGGEATVIEEYPFAVSLQNNGTFFGHEVEHFCGGCIVGQKWIITSAQCALRFQAKPFHVRAGTSRYYQAGDIYDVQSVLIHPAFNPINYDYDVGLVELSEGIKFDKTKQPIKLPKTQMAIEDGSLVKVLGWGVSELLGPVSDQLLTATMRKISSESCETNNIGNPVTNRMFCAVSENIGPCVGDSGSPLVYQNTLLGVASWRRSCTPAYPTAFTSIVELKEWVNKVTGIE